MSTEKTPPNQGSTEGASSPAEEENPETYLQSTLLEIHELISDIENPFTLVGKLVSSLGKDKTLEILTGEKKDDEPKKDRQDQPPPLAPQLPLQNF